MRCQDTDRFLSSGATCSSQILTSVAMFECRAVLGPGLRAWHTFSPLNLHPRGSTYCRLSFLLGESGALFSGRAEGFGNVV